MNKPNIASHAILFAALVIFGGVSVLAQNVVSAGEPNYEATLYVVIGSDDGSQRSELPRSLSGVAKQISDNFTFKNYRLMNTYYGRLANNGSLEYKSVSSLKDVSTELDSPSFLDWQLANFRTESASGGKGSLTMQMFRFGARVPVVVSQPAQAGDRSVPITNYESVGLTLNRLSIPENSPTLIGTISLPRTTGTVFLVLAIKQV